eukprot:scaffold23435_cov63-Phaeocystis_antarctica.AAC.2
MESRFFGSISSGLYRGGASSILGMVYFASALSTPLLTGASRQVPHENREAKGVTMCHFLLL